MGEGTGICILRLYNADGQIITDHERITGDEHDHHPRGLSYTVLVNSQSIPASSAWEHRYDLGRSGYKTLRALLRGNENVNIIGHTGIFVMGTDTSGECTGIGIKPYGAGGYVTSYMGAYSRIHGDSYLTPPMFGGLVRLRDVYIDDDEAVLEFYNAAAFSRTMSVYGTVMVK